VIHRTGSEGLANFSLVFDYQGILDQVWSLTKVRFYGPSR